MSKSSPRLLTEDQFKSWLSERGISVLSDHDAASDFQDGLRDGVVLCQLVNQVKPGSIEDVSAWTSNTSH